MRSLTSWRVVAGGCLLPVGAVDCKQLHGVAQKTVACVHQLICKTLLTNSWMVLKREVATVCLKRKSCAGKLWRRTVTACSYQVFADKLVFSAQSTNPLATRTVRLSTIFATHFTSWLHFPLGFIKFVFFWFWFWLPATSSNHSPTGKVVHVFPQQPKGWKQSELRQQKSSVFISHHFNTSLTSV